MATIFQHVMMASAKRSQWKGGSSRANLLPNKSVCLSVGHFSCQCCLFARHNCQLPVLFQLAWTLHCFTVFEFLLVVSVLYCTCLCTGPGLLLNQDLINQLQAASYKIFGLCSWYGSQICSFTRAWFAKSPCGFLPLGLVHIYIYTSGLNLPRNLYFSLFWRIGKGSDMF